MNPSGSTTVKKKTNLCVFSLTDYGLFYYTDLVLNQTGSYHLKSNELVVIFTLCYSYII